MDAVSGRELLLILDNFERLIAAGPHVAALLAVCPRLQVIVTSRELLHISGEHAHSVARFKATMRSDCSPTAHAGSRNFALTAGNAATVDAICERVDRLPLAIELAAGRVRLFGLDALLARLERRLALLSGGRATCRRASRRCGQRSPGATTSLVRTSRISSAGWESSPAAAVSRRY